MKIAHFSDLHLLDLRGVSPFRFLNKRLTGYANLRLKRGHIHRSAYVQAIAREIRTQGVDHVVVTGDLTNLALETEFEFARQVLEQELGLDPDRVTVVPGNHDLYTRGAQRSGRFENYFGAYLKSDLPELAVNLQIGRFPIVKLRGPVAIIGLSSAVPQPPLVAAGKLGDVQLSALKDILRHPDVSSRTPVIALHHPVHNPPSRWKAWVEGLRDADNLASILQNLTRGLIVHGHLHTRVQRAFPNRNGPLIHVGATSASLHHEGDGRMAGFNIYEIGVDGSVGRIEGHAFEPTAKTFRVEDVPRWV